jgi:prophage maintenance system killer protein
MNKRRSTGSLSSGEEDVESIDYVKGDVEEIPDVNLAIYQSEQEYDLLSTKEDSLGGVVKRTLTNRRYSLEMVEKHLTEFFEGFPYDRTLTEQAALVMRWFAGMHFFEDANHRTGMSVLRTTMENNGIEPPSELQEACQRTETAIDASKKVREEGLVTPSKMYEKDELYEVWYNYFEDVL